MRAVFFDLFANDDCLLLSVLWRVSMFDMFVGRMVVIVDIHPFRFVRNVSIIFDRFPTFPKFLDVFDGVWRPNQ